MKKIILAMLALSVMATAEQTSYYVGLGITGNQTTAKSNGSDYLGHSKGEFTNMGVQLSAGYLMLEREKL